MCSDIGWLSSSLKNRNGVVKLLHHHTSDGYKQFVNMGGSSIYVRFGGLPSFAYWVRVLGPLSIIDAV